MGQNVLGAMFGGVLEYHSMYFGFSTLCLVAILPYVAAFFASLRPAHSVPGAREPRE
jgi:hypothetical protein